MVSENEENREMGVSEREGNCARDESVDPGSSNYLCRPHLICG